MQRASSASAVRNRMDEGARHVYSDSIGRLPSRAVEQWSATGIDARAMCSCVMIGKARPHPASGPLQGPCMPETAPQTADATRHGVQPIDRRFGRPPRDAGDALDRHQAGPGRCRDRGFAGRGCGRAGRGHRSTAWCSRACRPASTPAMPIWKTCGSCWSCSCRSTGGTISNLWSDPAPRIWARSASAWGSATFGAGAAGHQPHRSTGDRHRR